jgi:ABC transporter substrate binding protein
MKRRELLGILGIAALSRPAAVWAQPSKKPRIGYLMDRSGPGPLEDGGLIAYGPRLSEVRQCARQVAKLLRGAKVADVPVEQLTEFELIINLKTGVEIPPALLSRANIAIE